MSEIKQEQIAEVVMPEPRWKDLYKVGGISGILMAIAGTLYLGWSPLLARDFFQLAKDGLKA